MTDKERQEILAKMERFDREEAERRGVPIEVVRREHAMRGRLMKMIFELDFVGRATVLGYIEGLRDFARMSPVEQEEARREQGVHGLRVVREEDEDGQ